MNRRGFLALLAALFARPKVLAPDEPSADVFADHARFREMYFSSGPELGHYTFYDARTGRSSAPRPYTPSEIQAWYRGRFHTFTANGAHHVRRVPHRRRRRALARSAIIR